MAGRPRIYSTAEEMEAEIEAYISSCKANDEKATITGLAYHLGFESRQSIYDYKEEGEFSYIIKRALLFIESKYEQALHGNSVAGPIFVLKNMGWKDKTEVEKSVTGSMTVNYIAQPGNAPLDEAD